MQHSIYMGQMQITTQQFMQIEQQMNAGKKLEAIKLIRLYTNLSLTDAKYIADHFDSIDFAIPHELIHNCSRKQSNTPLVTKKVGKGVGLVALLSGYSIFQIIAGLVKPFLGKQK